MRSSVVLPEPDGPRRPRNSRSPISRSTRSSTSAELADRPAIAKQDAVEKAPFDVRQRHAPEDLAAAGAEHDGGLFLAGAFAVHQRDQLARDERQRHEQRREG